MDEPRFFNPFAEVRRHGSRIPHWQQPGATYFVTFRLADSLPKTQLDEWREDREIWLRKNPKPWSEETEAEYHRLFSLVIDGWLDRGAGACILKEERFRTEVEAALFRFEGERSFLHSVVLMPNHVHALLTMSENVSLERTIKAWKGVSAREINRLRGGSGAIWAKHYFDRMIRDREHFFRVARYIRSNPEKGRLRSGEFFLHETDGVRRMLSE